MSELIVDDMKEISEMLKKRRIEMNLSLKEVENVTSIRMSYLQAIEEGDFKKLISPVYAQGFVKQYAIFLGIDGDSIIREHPHLFNKKEHQDFAYGIGTLEMRNSPGAGVKWVPNLLWIVAFVGLFGLAWYLAKAFEVL
ncbi:MAG: helix-turn-helix domain-containing protein [Parachlamydiaceae bacterium]